MKKLVGTHLEWFFCKGFRALWGLKLPTHLCCFKSLSSSKLLSPNKTWWVNIETYEICDYLDACKQVLQKTTELKIQLNPGQQCAPIVNLWAFWRPLVTISRRKWMHSGCLGVQLSPRKYSRVMGWPGGHLCLLVQVPVPYEPRINRIMKETPEKRVVGCWDLGGILQNGWTFEMDPWSHFFILGFEEKQRDLMTWKTGSILGWFMRWPQ